MSDISSGVGFGVVTALPVEYAAICRILDRQQTVSLQRDPSHYLVGEVPSARPDRPHRIALTLLPRDGTRTAAAACAYLLAGFPSVRAILMIGIAGGVPAVDNPGKHVRLGDVVVATDIIDYGHVRAVDGAQEIRARIDAPSFDLTMADRILQASEVNGQRPWEAWLETDSAVSRVFARPEPETDLLIVGNRLVAHPDDSIHGRRPGFPRVHRCAVASGDQLVRDEAARDRLAELYGVCAIEMEGVGIAAGTMLRGVPWFMVRGIADYCNNSKNDSWHPYASLAAAAYARALLGHCEPVNEPGELVLSSGSALVNDRYPLRQTRFLPRGEHAADPIQSLQAIVDAMLEIGEVLDSGGRSVLLTLLPRNIQTAVTYQPSPRLQVITIVRTCSKFHEGQQALVSALRACVPEGSMALARAEMAIALNWDGLTN